jgi:hypothetical protein
VVGVLELLDPTVEWTADSMLSVLGTLASQLALVVGLHPSYDAPRPLEELVAAVSSSGAAGRRLAEELLEAVSAYTTSTR